MPRGVNPYDEGRIQGRNVVNANSSNIVAPGIVTDGLVLHLDAGNYESYPIAGTSWYDLSGGRNTGTFRNGSTYVRDGGGAISLDGTNDKVDTDAGPDFAYGTGDFALEIWFNNTSSPTSGFGVMFSQSISGTNYFIAGINNSLKAEFIFATSGAGTVTLSSNTYSLSTWNHYVATRMGSSVIVYLNTTASSATTCTQNFTNTTYLPTIGAYQGSSLNCFPGYISIVRVYKNKGLSPTEVAQNFNATRARFNI